jgi:decaprenylphospho-beta-D-ribofuranose 2-oxidase
MNFTEKISLTSFDKSHSTDVFFKRPEKYKEIEKFSKESDNLITMGSNYSYAPLSFDNKSIILDLKKFNRILNFDKKKKEITVEAGIKIFEFLNFVLNHNLWIPQLPGYPYISLGGAVATNAHGKSCGIDGTIRNSVKKILLYHKVHGWLNLSNTENKDIFDLTIGGLGLTGTIVSITFGLTEFDFTDFTTTKKKVFSIQNVLKNLFNQPINKSIFIYSWNIADDLENFGKGYIFENIPKKNLEKIPKIKTLTKHNYSLPFCLWNKLTIKIFNKIYLKFLDFEEQKKNESFLKTIFPFIGKESYFKLFGSKGFIESQLLVPNAIAYDFLEEIKNLCRIHKPLITLFSLKMLSGEQKLLRFEGNGVCVTLDFVNNKKNHLFLGEVDNLCIKYNVLPSIIKDSRLSQPIFDRCYSEAESFRKRLTDFDRDRIYQSGLSKRLKI